MVSTTFVLTMAHVKARIWPGLAYVFQVCSTVGGGEPAGLREKVVCFLERERLDWLFAQQRPLALHSCGHIALKSLRFLTFEDDQLLDLHPSD